MIVLKIIGIVLLALALLICLILLLPVGLWLRADPQNGIRIRYRFLWWLFGEEPDPKNPIVRGLKKTLGISHLESLKTIRGAVEDHGATVTLKETVETLMLLIDRVVWALQRCRVKKFRILSISAGEDAPLDYGVACATVYPLAGWLQAKAKMNRRALELDLTCDYEREDAYYEVEVYIQLRVHHLLRALLHIVKANVENELAAAEAAEGGA